MGDSTIGQYIEAKGAGYQLHIYETKDSGYILDIQKREGGIKGAFKRLGDDFQHLLAGDKKLDKNLTVQILHKMSRGSENQESDHVANTSSNVNEAARQILQYTKKQPEQMRPMYEVYQQTKMKLTSGVMITQNASDKIRKSVADINSENKKRMINKLNKSIDSLINSPPENSTIKDAFEGSIGDRINGSLNGVIGPEVNSSYNQFFEMQDAKSGDQSDQAIPAPTLTYNQEGNRVTVTGRLPKEFVVKKEGTRQTEVFAKFEMNYQMEFKIENDGTFKCDGSSVKLEKYQEVRGASSRIEEMLTPKIGIGEVIQEKVGELRQEVSESVATVKDAVGGEFIRAERKLQKAEEKLEELPVLGPALRTKREKAEKAKKASQQKEMIEQAEKKKEQAKLEAQKKAEEAEKPASKHWRKRNESWSRARKISAAKKAAPLPQNQKPDFTEPIERTS